MCWAEINLLRIYIHTALIYKMSHFSSLICTDRKKCQIERSSCRCVYTLRIWINFKYVLKTFKSTFWIVSEIFRKWLLKCRRYIRILCINVVECTLVLAVLLILTLILSVVL